MDDGSKIGHYEIRKKIGSGGMGEVYLAHDTKLDRKVAIKFLNEKFSKDADKETICATMLATMICIKPKGSDL